MKGPKYPAVSKSTPEKVVATASVIAVVLYPCLFMYFQNAGEASFVDILGVSAAMLAAALALCVVINTLFMKDLPKTTIAVNAGMLLFMNFAYIESALAFVFPNLYYWHVLIILTFIWLLLIAFLKKSGSRSLPSVNSILLLVFAVLIVINGATAAPVIANKVKKMNERRAEQIEVQSEPGYYPNIYYFIFDEYGGIDNLKRYCGYDNSPFYERLREIGFNVSEQSRNECDSTYTIIPNLLNLDYVNYGGQTNDQNDIALRKEKLKSPVINQLLLSYGYKINVLDSSSFLDKEQASFTFENGYSGVEGSAAYYILQRTAVYPFYRNSSSAEIQNLLNMVDYAKGSAKFAQSNLFTIGYFPIPHVPWFVDENGNAISGADRMNYYNTDIYLGEVKYGNKLIEDIVLSIIRDDPTCVIILQSDHGFRWNRSGPEEDEETFMFYKRNILNAVYYQGEHLDIEGQTGINTLRMILNGLLGTDLEMINPGDYEKLGEIMRS